MNGRELPVLNFAPFREYPTRQQRQTFNDERQVCSHCLSGACCSSEHPIALRSFDVLRLAAFFEMTPADFLLSFTQDNFRDEPSDRMRRRSIDDINCSVVTYLRRRENSPTSPCIFIKYIKDPDGTPRRVCSVHDARPLACREFFFDTCKKRVTGELAALLAEGYEKVRDGEITAALADDELSKFVECDRHTMTLAQEMEHSFWAEMKRATNVDRANNEGANSYETADYQDPIAQKLNRLRLKKRLRLKRRRAKLDPELISRPHDFTFARSEEYQRILKLLGARPSNGLYASGDYRPFIGVRTLFSGIEIPRAFATIPAEEINTFISGLPGVRLFPDHERPGPRGITLRDVYTAALKGYNYLIGFASYLAVMGDVLEDARRGEFESDMLSMIAGFQTSLNPFLARNPYLEPVKHRLAEATLEMIEQDLAAAESPEEEFDVLRLLYRVHLAVPSLDPQLRARFDAITTAIHARLRKSRLDLYVRLDSPVETRRLEGKRLNARQPWAVLFDQVLDMRYAATAGFDGVDLSAFYEQAVTNLEKIQFRKSYGLDLYNVVRRLARSMSFDNTIAHREMSYKAAADKLASYAVRFFNWMEETSFETHDCEIIAEFPSAIYRGLGLSYSCDPSFGLIVYRILDAQLADGSWKTNPLPADASGPQTDYLYVMYSATCACVDALRPMRADVLHHENKALGLV